MKLTIKEFQSFREILSRSFATIDQDNITGERKETLIDGKSVVTGHHFLADFEIDALIEALRLTVANKPQK